MIQRELREVGIGVGEHVAPRAQLRAAEVDRGIDGERVAPAEVVKPRADADVAPTLHVRWRIANDDDLGPRYVDAEQPCNGHP